MDVLWDTLKFFYFIFEGILETVFPVAWVRRKQFPVRGKLTVVTGAANGIGRAIALELAKNGSDLILLDVNEDGMRDVSDQIKLIGRSCHFMICDVSNKEEVKRVAKLIEATIGKVDILVNNAGIAVLQSILNHSDAEIERTLQINLHAHFWTIRAFLPAMIAKRSGHIVGISSIAGLCGAARVSAYCAAKFGVVGLFESFRAELEFSGLAKAIGITCVCPFYVRTRLLHGAKVGRGEFIMPPLDPGYLASRIVQSIEYRKEMLLLPWAITLLSAMHSILPVKTLLCLSRLCGIEDGLQNVPEPSTLAYLPAKYQ